MNHQEFIFDLKNSYKGLLAQLEQEEAEAPSAHQKNPKFFLTENDNEMDTEVNTGSNLKLPLTKQQLLNLLVVLEENNLFLINNMQEEDQGLEEASKASDSTIRTYTEKLSEMQKKVHKLEEQIVKFKHTQSILKQYDDSNNDSTTTGTTKLTSENVQKLQKAVNLTFWGLFSDENSEVDSEEKLRRVEILLLNKIEKVMERIKAARPD